MIDAEVQRLLAEAKVLRARGEKGPALALLDRLLAVEMLPEAVYLRGVVEAMPDGGEAPPTALVGGDAMKPLDDDLIGLVTAWHDGALVLRWDWPGGARELRVAVWTEGAALTDREIEAGASPAYEGEFKRRGFYVVTPRTRHAAVFVRISRCHGGECLATHRVEVPRPAVRWAVRVEPRPGATPQRFIELRGPDMRLTDLRLIRSAEYVALRPGEGTCVERLRELTLTAGRATIALSHPPTGELLRLFPGDADHRRGVWFLSEAGRDRDVA